MSFWGHKNMIISFSASYIYALFPAAWVIIELNSIRPPPVAEWLRPLIFSFLNHSSSHCCRVEPSLGHMWDKPILLAVGDQVVFLGGSPIFAPPTDWRLKMSEIILMGRKHLPRIKKIRDYVGCLISRLRYMWMPLYGIPLAWCLCVVHSYEPLHDKTNKVTVRPAKTQISLGICPVWSESSLCTQWVAKDASFLHADSEDSDQTGRMPRLIWVFAGRTVT